MKILAILIFLFSGQLWGQSNFVDQNLNSVTNTNSLLYSFDSTFQRFRSEGDLRLKVRHSKFDHFFQEDKKLTGELIRSQGSFHWTKNLVQKLLIIGLKGSLTMSGGRIEYSEFKEVRLDSLSLNNVRILNTIWSDFTAKKSEFKDVVFHETNLQGVTLPGLKAENVKFLGRTAAMNLRGCDLRNVEFNFDRIEHLSFVECRLEGVYVNGNIVTESTILKGE